MSAESKHGEVVRAILSMKRQPQEDGKKSLMKTFRSTAVSIDSSSQLVWLRILRTESTSWLVMNT